MYNKAEQMPLFHCRSDEKKSKKKLTALTPIGVLYCPLQALTGTTRNSGTAAIKKTKKNKRKQAHAGSGEKMLKLCT